MMSNEFEWSWMKLNEVEWNEVERVDQVDQVDYVYQGEKPRRPWKQKIYHNQEWWTTYHTIN